MNGLRGFLKDTAAYAGFATLAFHCTATIAQDGVLDPTFGSSGIVEIPWPAGSAEANAVALDGNGRIVVGGYAMGSAEDADFSLFRLSSNGSIDLSYAHDGGGFRLVDFNLAGIGGKSDDSINDVSTLSDGSVVALGEAHFGVVSSQFALAKTDANGVIDSAFGDGGTAHFGFDTFNNWDQGMLLKVDSAARIVVSGSVIYAVSGDPSVNYRVGIARLTSVGRLDTDFYGNGYYYAPLWGDPGTAIRARYSLVSALLFDFSQRIVVQGTFFEPYPQQIGVMRGPENGGFDPEFGGSVLGRVQLQLTNGSGGAVAALAGGKLMTSGTFGITRSDTPFLMRLNEDGSLDTDFANAGLATATALDSDHYAIFNFLTRTKAGGWLLAGSYGTLSNDQVIGEIMVRFDANGIPDASFGDNGTVTLVPDANRPFTAHRAALQPDGKLIVAGSFLNSDDPSTPHFAVVRILADYNTMFVNGFEAAP